MKIPIPYLATLPQTRHIWKCLYLMRTLKIIRKVTWISPGSPVWLESSRFLRDLFHVLPKSFNEPLHFLGFSLDTDVGLKFPECFIQLHCGEVHLIHHTARTETDSHNVSSFLTTQYQREDFETEKTFPFSIWHRFMELFLKLSTAIAIIAGKLWRKVENNKSMRMCTCEQTFVFFNRRATEMTNILPLSVMCHCHK